MLIKRLIQITLILAVLFSSLAFTHSVSANAYCGSTYVVQTGDWLSKIAGRCGITLSALIAANPWVSYYYYIYPGQVLNIPDGYTPAPGPVPGGGGYYQPNCGHPLPSPIMGIIMRSALATRCSGSQTITGRTCGTSSGITASAMPTYLCSPVHWP